MEGDAGESVGELRELVTVVPDARARGHRFKLLVPPCRTELLRRFFGVRSVGIWNGLPSELIEVDTLEAFKRGLTINLGDILYGVL